MIYKILQFGEIINILIHTCQKGREAGINHTTRPKSGRIAPDGKNGENYYAKFGRLRARQGNIILSFM
jgi:hypothetical protein